MIRRIVSALCLWCLSAVATASCLPSPSQSAMLTIYGTTDTGVFEPVLHDFRSMHPSVVVCYIELNSAMLYERFLHEVDEGHPQADLLLSTSMDLQVKLVNDGYAAPHVSENARAMPAWARWRDEAFGLTFEPAVMVFNRKAMGGREIPRTRQELLELLKRDREHWHGRIGTYDISHSGVGYLLASQDARQSSEFGALVETFDDVGMQTDEHTADLLDRLESGNLAIGYNLLGSYARKRVEAGAPLIIVYPQDYTLAVSRTAVLPKSAPHPAMAHAFLEYLLSLRGQRVLATQAGLPAIRREIEGPYGRMGITGGQVGLLRPIALGPGLLVYLDQQKRQHILASWRAVIGEVQP